jgi:hypothetical protein
VLREADPAGAAEGLEEAAMAYEELGVAHLAGQARELVAG